jgi:uncharacterized protein YciI
MSGFAILGWDGADAEAAARRARVRSPHLAVITRWAEAGRLSLGVPLFREDGSTAGSLMILGEEDEVGLKEYLAEEPFAREGVWLSYQARPFRIAPLPYHRLPHEGQVPDIPTHRVLIAEDGEGAARRRASARAAHVARMEAAAAEGVLACGGALLGPDGAVVGSIAVTRHASEAEARRWWAEDPFVTQEVWAEMTFHATRFAPLPYHPLPGSAA